MNTTTPQAPTTGHQGRCCAACLHFTARQGHEVGICTSRPPTPVLVGKWAYPETHAHDGATCDGYQRASA